MTEKITTAEELDALPVGSVVLDRDGDEWTKQATPAVWVTPETRPFGSEHVTRKWAPLTLVSRPDAPAPPLRPEADREALRVALTDGYWQRTGYRANWEHIGPLMDAILDAGFTLAARQPAPTVSAVDREDLDADVERALHTLYDAVDGSREKDLAFEAVSDALRRRQPAPSAEDFDVQQSDDGITRADEDREALVRRLQDEVEYRVRTAAALAKFGHSVQPEVDAGRARIAALASYRSAEDREALVEREPLDLGAIRATLAAAAPTVSAEQAKAAAVAMNDARWGAGEWPGVPGRQDLDQVGAMLAALGIEVTP